MLTAIKNVVRLMIIAVAVLMVAFVVVVTLSAGIGLLLHGVNP